jgi:hypothetical protein
VYLSDFDLQQWDEQKLMALPGEAERWLAGEVAVGFERGAGAAQGELPDQFSATPQ